MTIFPWRWRRHRHQPESRADALLGWVPSGSGSGSAHRPMGICPEQTRDPGFATDRIRAAKTTEHGVLPCGAQIRPTAPGSRRINRGRGVPAVGPLVVPGPGGVAVLPWTPRFQAFRVSMSSGQGRIPFCQEPSGSKGFAVSHFSWLYQPVSPANAVLGVGQRLAKTGLAWRLLAVKITVFNGTPENVKAMAQ